MAQQTEEIETHKAKSEEEKNKQNKKLLSKLFY